ncbi:MAG: hypothetical protein AAF478_02805 [Pseudomonadota bacterium]
MRKVFSDREDRAHMKRDFEKATVGKNENSRPKKYPSPITFRPTDEERLQLKQDAAGMSLSAYIRQCLFGSRVSKRVIPDVDRLLLAQILAKLGESRIANNLNQIAYHANCGSLMLDELTIEEINEACVHVAWMRTQLINALGLKTRPQNKQTVKDSEAAFLDEEYL